MSEHSRFKEIREEKRYKQKEFAEVLNLKNWQTCKNIEIGKQKVSVEIATKIEDEFNINMRWLLTGRGDKYLKDEQNKLTIPNKINFNISQKEIEILTSYRELNKDYQIKYYAQVIGAAADERIKAQEQDEEIEKDAKSAV